MGVFCFVKRLGPRVHMHRLHMHGCMERGSTCVYDTSVVCTIDLLCRCILVSKLPTLGPTG